jgi:hypothetical protein
VDLAAITSNSTPLLQFGTSGRNAIVFQAAPNIVQVEMVYTASEQVCENVFHVKTAAAPTLLDLQTIGTTFDAYHLAHLVTSQTSEVFLQRIVMTDLGSISGLRFDHVMSPARQGTAAGNPQPNNVTLALKWGTGLRGRSNRGRTYLIGMSDSLIGSDGQEVTSTALGNLLSAWTPLPVAIAAAGAYTMVVLSRRNGGALRPTGVGIPITDCSAADPFIDSQRRRLPAHNRHR